MGNILALRGNDFLLDGQSDEMNLTVKQLIQMLAKAPNQDADVCVMVPMPDPAQIKIMSASNLYPSTDQVFVMVAGEYDFDKDPK